MKSVIYVGDGKVELQDVPKPELVDPTSVLVKVHLSTLCGSDVHVLKGEQININPPFPLGHEAMGTVEEIGSAVKNIKVGDRVAVPPAIYCGCCFNCGNDVPGWCENGGVMGHGSGWGGLDGCLSEYVRVPRADSCLCKVPDNVTDEQALFVGDILTTAYSCAVDGSIQHGDTVVVYGLGPVGQCAVLCSRLFSPLRVIAVGGRDKSRTELAAKIGADVTLLSSEDDVVARILELTDGRGADVSLECAGNPSSYLNAYNSTRIGGHISICGVFGKPFEMPMNELCTKNMTVKHGLGNITLIPRVMKLVEAGKLDASPLITHHMKLSQIDEAIDLFVNQPEPCMKIAIDVRG